MEFVTFLKEDRVLIVGFHGMGVLPLWSVLPEKLVEVGQDVFEVVVPRGAVLGHASLEDIPHLGRAVGPDFPDIRWFHIQDRTQEFVRVVGEEGSALSQEFVGGDSESIDVASDIEGFTSDLLRREVRRGPHRLASQGEMSIVVNGLGDPEIHQLDLAIGENPHVGRLDIAMQDAAPMRMGESTRELDQVEELGCEREIVVATDLRVQVLALQELLHQIGDFALLRKIVGGDEIAVVEGRSQSGLVLESLPDFEVTGPAGLDCHPALEARVVRFVDVPEPTLTDLCNDLVAADLHMPVGLRGGGEVRGVFDRFGSGSWCARITLTYLHEAREGEALEKLAPGLFVDATLLFRGQDDEFETQLRGTPERFVYDLASITKPFTASAALWCAARGDLDLEEPVFPEQLNPAPRLEDLLRHLGGARAWWPLYLPGMEPSVVPTREQFWPGVRGVYSDLGYVTAARWIEKRTRRDLLDLLAAFVEDQLPGLRFDAVPFPVVRLREEAGRAPDAVGRACPCSTGKEVALAEELGLAIEDLGPPVFGEPQDGNARWLRGRQIFPGHAGLFGTAAAVGELASRWIQAARGEAHAPLDMLLRSALIAVDGRLLGWQTPPPEWKLPSDVFGHFGFTGGSVWLDPTLGSSMVFLAHRRDPHSNLEPSRRAVAEAWQRWTRRD